MSEDLERRLRHALHSAPLPDAPPALRTTLDGLPARGPARAARRRRQVGRLVTGLAAVAIIALLVAWLPGRLSGPAVSPSPTAPSPAPTTAPTGAPFAGIRWTEAARTGGPDSPFLDGDTVMAGTAWQGGFVLVGNADRGQRAVVWTAADGLAWQRDESGPDFSTSVLQTVVPIAGGLLAVGTATAGDSACAGGVFGCNPAFPIRLWTSKDGRTWQRLPDASMAPFGRAQILSVAAGPAGVLAAGDQVPVTGDPKPMMWTSGDGRTWRAAPQFAGAFPGAVVDAVAGSSLGFVAVGRRFGQGPSALGGAWFSTDGSSWTEAKEVPGGPPELTFVVAAAGGLVAGGSTGTRSIVWSQDGRVWRPADQAAVPFALGGSGPTLLSDGGRILALGFDAGGAPGAWTSGDGSAWQVVPQRGAPTLDGSGFGVLSSAGALLVEPAGAGGSGQTVLWFGAWSVPPSVQPSPSPSGPPPGTPATVTSRPPAPDLFSLGFAGTSHGWAGGAGLILATSDGGATWQRQWSGSDSVVEIEALDERDVWAVAASATATGASVRNRLLVTTDGGASWVALPLTRQVTGLDVVGPGDAWAIDAAGGPGPGTLVHTTDGGRTWSPLSVGAVGSVCFADALHGWAAGARVLRTTDGGRSWQAVSATFPAWAGGDTTLRCSGSALWLFQGALGGATGNVNYAGYRSTDGGAHWTQVLGNPYFPGTPAGVGSADAEPGPFAAPDGSTAVELGASPNALEVSVTVTRDGGATWKSVPITGVGLEATALAAPDPTHLWIAGTGWGLGGYLLASADGGQTWRQQWPTASPAPVGDIAFVRTSLGYGVGLPGDARAFVRTTDGGSTWTRAAELPDGIGGYNAHVLSFADAAHGWIVTATGHLLATDDGGATWRQLPDPAGSSPIVGNGPVTQAALADSRHGCVAASVGTGAQLLEATSDGGATWQPAAGSDVLACAEGTIGIRLLASLSSLSPGSPTLPHLAAVTGQSDAWATVVDGALAVTHDGGATWTSLVWPASPRSPDPMAFSGPFELSFVDSANGWMLANDHRLYRTTDGGRSWTQLPGGGSSPGS